MQSINTISVRKTSPCLGAEVLGVDLSKPMDDATFAEIEEAFHEHCLLVFRDQKLSEVQHIEFSKRFGSLEIHLLKQYLDDGFPEIHVISNVVRDGKPVGIADAGRIWHADYSYREVPARASLLYARQVPQASDGRPLGDTLFTNTAEAYDTLPGELKTAVHGLKAIHNYAKYYDRKRREGSSRTALDQQQMQEVAAGMAQPVIRTHPHTGRKCIYASEGITTGGIVGKDEEESRGLLTRLFEHLYRPEFGYRHKWKTGDLVLWDNCSTQHCATGDYGSGQPRLMHRTTVRGVGPAV